MSQYQQFSNYMKVADLKKLEFIIRSVNEEADRIGKPIRILEVGCGSGNIARPLASLGHNLIATDVDIESVKHTRRNPIPPSLNVAVMDACAGLASEKFHVVVCSEVLEHLKFPDIAIDGIKKSLLPGGLLIATVPNGFGPWELSNKILGKVRKVLGNFGLTNILRKIKRSIFHTARNDWSTLNPYTPHIQFFTFKKFSLLLQNSGFAIEKSAHSNFLLPALQIIDRVKFLEKIDSDIADRLPDFAVSGWYFTARLEHDVIK